MQLADWHQRTTLGRTGIQLSRIGLGSSYGIGTDGVEEAYKDYGINFFYWGTMRKEGFGEGIRRLAHHHREDLAVMIQSYSRFAGMMVSSFEKALSRLKLDYADIFLLGLHNSLPSNRIMDAALNLKMQGKAKSLGISCHRRKTFQTYIREGKFDVLMFRYSAAHRGAENDIFPYLSVPARPGTLAYTSTRWGQLVNPRKTPPGEKVPTASDCYRFVLSHPEVDLCMAGPADVTQMRQGLTAIDRGRMSPEELAWMQRVGGYIHR